MQFLISSRISDKEIPDSSRLKSLEKFLVNKFVLADEEDNSSGLLDRGGVSRFAFLENTISNLLKVPRAKFLGSYGLVCFIGISKFGSFKNPFVTITSLSELCNRFRRFIQLVKTKKVNSMNYGRSTNS